MTPQDSPLLTAAFLHSGAVDQLLIEQAPVPQATLDLAFERALQRDEHHVDRISRIQTVSTLLDAGASLHTDATELGCSNVIAAASRDADLLTLLIARGADLNRGGPLHFICGAFIEQDSAARTLLECGADPNAYFAGATPIHEAVLRERTSTVHLLLAFGADPSMVLEASRWHYFLQISAGADAYGLAAAIGCETHSWSTVTRHQT